MTEQWHPKSENTPGEDAMDVADEMDDVAGSAETTGIDEGEIGDWGFPEEFAPLIKIAMGHWETGCYHLREGHKAMKAVAEAIRAKETSSDK